MDVKAEQGPVGDIVGSAEFDALRSEVADLRARLASYEQILQLRDAALVAGAVAQPPAAGPAPPRPDLPPSFEISADQLLPAQDGFYQLEWGPEGAFRWTGPNADVHFEAWLDRREPVLATLRLFHFGTPANAKELALEVDGTIYPLARQANQKLLRSEPIAPRPGDGPTRITLKVAHLHSPAERGLADKRTLGVAFQRLRIERG
jgi:hypothetical protein